MQLLSESAALASSLIRSVDLFICIFLYFTYVNIRIYIYVQVIRVETQTHVYLQHVIRVIRFYFSRACECTRAFFYASFIIRYLSNNVHVII